MATNGIFRSVLLASGVLLIAACASQSTSTVSLDDRYFEKETNNYQKYQNDEGQTLYCQNVKNTASLIPFKWCITETDLRQLVEDRRRSRNTASGAPMPAGVGQGSIGGN